MRPPPSMLRLMLRRELLLVWERRTSSMLPLFFFVLSASLFPLGVNPEPAVLREIAPGVIWVCALLSNMLALPGYFGSDLADGSLEQMMLSGRSMALMAASKALAYWLLSGLALMILAPLLALMFGMGARHLGVLELSLLLGTPVLSLVACFSAALTLGVRNGSVLGLLLAVPLCIPVLIFASGALAAADAGLSSEAHLSLLGALALIALPLMPFAASAALRMAID